MDPAAQAAQAAPEQKKRGLPVSGGFLARVGIIGAIVVGGLIFRDRLSGAATDLRVGDCFDEPVSMTEVTDVQHQPCTEPHDGEIMFVGDYPDQADYPGNDAFDAYAEANCIPAFESYIGRDYETDTEFNIGTFYPISEGWSSGDHEITCYVFRIDEAKMNASVKGIG